MKEFIVFIKNTGNPVVNLPQEQQQRHIQKVGGFIQSQFEAGRMKAAQPLEMEGAIISKKQGHLVDEPFDVTGEVVSGYYHIVAPDLAAAIELSKNDPRFQDGEWRLEVRPVMVVEGIN